PQAMVLPTVQRLAVAAPSCDLPKRVSVVIVRLGARPAGGWYSSNGPMSQLVFHAPDIAMPAGRRRVNSPNSRPLTLPSYVCDAHRTPLAPAIRVNLPVSRGDACLPPCIRPATLGTFLCS